MAAAALAKFRFEMFPDAGALMRFVTKADSPVATITAIVSDGSGQLVLFYLIA